MAGTVTKQPFKNLRRGPNKTWLPGRAHEVAIYNMTVWLISNLGLEQSDAERAAFALWREAQKANYR
jgi:hypothetical protein